jgi:hypothetical protein
MQTLKTLLIPILITLLLIFSAVNNITSNTSSKKTELLKSIKELDMLPVPNTRIKDTVFVQGSSYVEISLNEQMCRLYLRDSNKKNNNDNRNCIEYKISSGNSNIPEGLETTTGLFTVQSKNPLGKSRQFEDAELYNWIGFNVNFGIHGLAGNGYYRTLGVKPSSHGCVRIAREDGKVLYDKVKFGTPVLVYTNEPAIQLKFIDTITSLSKYYVLPSNARLFNNIIEQRRQNIYNSVAYLNSNKKLLMDGETIVRYGGYRIGKAENIPYKQKIQNPQLNIILLVDNISVNYNVIEKYISEEKDK